MVIPMTVFGTPGKFLGGFDTHTLVMIKSPYMWKVWKVQSHLNKVYLRK